MSLRVLTALCALACALPAHAQDPNLANPTQMVTVNRGSYTISALVTHLESAKQPKYGIALFPGHPGIMKLEEEAGRFKFGLGGNFLVRSRRWWLDDDILVAVIDAPSDQWNTFSQTFRETARYGADIEALIKAVGAKFNVSDWTYVGTSEGSISAFHAGRMNPSVAKRVILTASVFRAGRNGPGLSGVDYSELASQLLFVHHEDDPCEYTQYRDAQAHAKKSGKPLITVRGGGPARGQACMAQTQHGFVGVEVEAVKAMRSWVKTGAVPADAGK